MGSKKKKVASTRDGMLDLDALIEEPTEEAAEEVTGPTELAPMHFGEGTDVEGTLDKAKKLVYLIDVSPSMGQGMPLDAPEKLFHWNPELLKRMREAIMQDAKANCMSEETAKEQGLFEHIQEVLEDNSEEGSGSIAALIAKHNKQELKDLVRIVNYLGWNPMEDSTLMRMTAAMRLHQRFPKVHLVPTEKLGESKSRINIVKDSARQALEKRYDKVGRADVMVLTFSDMVYHPVRRPSKQAVMRAIDELYTKGWGTNIALALTEAIRIIEQTPSKLNVNQIVLVTDAEDRKYEGIVRLKDRLEKNNITLDFILISDPTARKYRENDQMSAVLLQMAKDTGGEFVEVRHASDFTQRFFKASERKLLPAYEKGKS